MIFIFLISKSSFLNSDLKKYNVGFFCHKYSVSFFFVCRYHLLSPSLHLHVFWYLAFLKYLEIFGWMFLFNVGALKLTGWSPLSGLHWRVAGEWTGWPWVLASGLYLKAVPFPGGGTPLPCLWPGVYEPGILEAKPRDLVSHRSPCRPSLRPLFSVWLFSPVFYLPAFSEPRALNG